MRADAPLHTVIIDNGLRLGYRELGSGPSVLLLHGWPTSSYLWRNVMPAIAARNRVIAIDLPGFGASDKPTDVRYGFSYFSAALDGFLTALSVDSVSLVGHDLGGPVALHWAMRNRDRLRSVGLLNTLVYPELSDAVIDFVTTLIDPSARDDLTGADGLRSIMRLGVVDASVLTADVLDAVLDPFSDEASRLALAKAGIGLSRRGFADIAAALPAFDVPVRLIYGEQDRVLPDVADTMSRLASDLPNVEVTALPHCGHFVQEEQPDRVGELLAPFLASASK